MSNEKGAGKVINMIKCVGGGRWNDGLCIIERRERERERESKTQKESILNYTHYTTINMIYASFN